MMIIKTTMKMEELMVEMEQLMAMTTVTKIMIMQMENNKMDNRMIMMKMRLNRIKGGISWKRHSNRICYLPDQMISKAKYTKN